MDLATIEKYIGQITALEFSARDDEIATSSVSLIAEMGARGLLQSTITLSKFADFVNAEFSLRAELAAQYLLPRLSVITKSAAQEKQGDAVTLYKSLATEQRIRLEACYDRFATPVTAALQSSMPAQIREQLLARMASTLKKHELVLEFECALAAGGQSKEILTLRPSIYGIGVDLKELWSKIFGQ